MTNAKKNLNFTVDECNREPVRTPKVPGGGRRSSQDEIEELDLSTEPVWPIVRIYSWCGALLREYQDAKVGPIAISLTLDGKRLPVCGDFWRDDHKYALSVYDRSGKVHGRGGGETEGELRCLVVVGAKNKVDCRRVFREHTGGTPEGD